MRHYQSVLMLLAVTTTTSLLVGACSDDGSGAMPEEAGARTDPDASAAEDSGTSGRDAGAKNDASEDAASKDAGIDAAACLPDQLPTAACTSGLGVTYTAGALPAQKFASAASSNIDLKIDKGGVHHAAWTELRQGPNIRYMTNASGTFKTESVAGPTGPTGLPSEQLDFVRLIVDTCGRPTVIYRRAYALVPNEPPLARHIFVASRGPSGWTEEEVVVPKSATDGTPATDFIALDAVMDANNTLLIVTRRATILQPVLSHFQPVLSKRAPGGWTHETVPAAAGAYEQPRIAWSSTMGLVLAYSTLTPGRSSRPAVAVKNGGKWTEFELSGSDQITGETPIYVTTSANGTVHLAYKTYTSPTSSTLMRYSSLASVVTGPTVPVPVPLPHAVIPFGIRVLTSQAGVPRILFQQLGLSPESTMHTYVSTMSAGAFGAATDLGPYKGFGAAIDGNDRVHVFANQETFIGTDLGSWHLTQACAP